MVSLHSVLPVVMGAGVFFNSSSLRIIHFRLGLSSVLLPSLYVYEFIYIHRYIPLGYNIKYTKLLERIVLSVRVRIDTSSYSYY